jgi:hypothetical protein
MTVGPGLRGEAVGWLERILQERLCGDLRLERSGSEVLLRLHGADGSIRFERVGEGFLDPAPDVPCGLWSPEDEGWRAPLGRSLPAPGRAVMPAPLVSRRGLDRLVGYDILGLCHWMLARVEETERGQRDEHDRFMATSSHACRHDYLDRPIVDEWLGVLGQIVQSVWPRAALRHHAFTMRVSHDVDKMSSYAFRPWSAVLWDMGVDAVRRGEWGSAAMGPWVRIASRRALHPRDPLNTFEWIMDTSERNGLVSAFYFISGRTDRSRDAEYDLGHPAVRDLMARIHRRGHEIGLHPSYATYRRPDEIAREARTLRRIAGECGVHQAELGGRMHFLRWEQPTTLLGLSDAGLAYDASLGYADQPGFRCGTCFEYPGFDPISGKMVPIRLRPLVAMEQTVMAERYLGLGTGDEALGRFARLKDACRRVGGCFTLLWHNHQMRDARRRELYERVLDA